MLEVLRIKNFAIIEWLEMHFYSGLNLISGETGTGKSILLDAIALLLGGRTRTDWIRAGCDEAVIEGVFSTTTLPWVMERLETQGFPREGNELWVKRSVHRHGKHRIFIQGELATLANLESICQGLIEVCGQHEHQSLNQAGVQLHLLDRYGDLKTQEVRRLFLDYQDCVRQKEQLQEQLKTQEQRMEWIDFQLQEIEKVNFQKGEEERLQQEKQSLQSVEVRLQLTRELRQILDSEERSLLQALKVGLQKLNVLVELDPVSQRLKECLSLLEQTCIEMQELSLSLGHYDHSIEFNAERLEKIQERLSVLAQLKRKYGGNLSAIQEDQDRLQNERQVLLTTERMFQECDERYEVLLKDWKTQVLALSQARQAIAHQLAQKITEELKELKMPDSVFSVGLETKEFAQWGSTGADQVQFLIQTNRGEVCHPLARIASGGELSRIFLAIRRIVSDQGGVGVYIFDEIDSGIGGQTAFEVGKKLKMVAQTNQVICITHLPQIAAFAQHHFSVTKQVMDGRTVTQMKELTADERQEEIARMLGGSQLTPRALANALELVELAQLEWEKVKLGRKHTKGG